MWKCLAQSPALEKALRESFCSGHLQEKPLSVRNPVNADATNPRSPDSEQWSQRCGDCGAGSTEEAQIRSDGGVCLQVYVTNLERLLSFKTQVHNIPAQAGIFPRGTREEKSLATAL